MIYLAAYLYVAGMPIAIHLTDELHTKVTPMGRAVVAMIWPLLFPVYLYAAVSVVMVRYAA